MILFLALCCVGVAVAGASAFVIFWPLTLVHLRDRHPALHAAFGSAAFLAPLPLRWLLSGQYRSLGDASLDGLATPARLSLLTLLAGAAAAATLALLSRMS